MPDSTALIHTIRGLLTVSRPHPMLDAAGELGILHAARLTGGGEAVERIDLHRLRLVRAIDRYIALVTPVATPNARRHTETVGAVVDRLANWCALAYTPGITATGNEIYFAETYVGQLAGGLDDLIAGLVTGSCTVPTVYTVPILQDASGIRMATRCPRRM
ncbi:DUF4254 domain-containing protein [Nocardia farcinica]|uniref:DUF4254 domain-containing protein n=1 Tax=Nocardia farcinica TaxID=37329 RepID=UPI001893E9E9|nr:DUF4254 domain-containing protein [Nocardia farcinica]MBF6388181.1 DUF4254 domain-containing protein [Nocardia farcinica]UEX26317.1 DUF4254 domain-containing protein [Nocardia farcinica]